jgi:predicted DNA-binding protein
MKSRKLTSVPVFFGTRVAPAVAKKFDRLVKKSGRTRSNYLDMIIREHVELKT